MLETPSKPTLQLEGIDQQDFTKSQLVEGCFPYQIGLQKRIPGKTLQEIHSGRVGSIYVFYSALGRQYILTDYGQLQIKEVVIPPITLPALPPTGNSWIDTFGSYDVDLISRLWPAGAWDTGVGVCETIIDGLFDPFSVYDTIPNGSTESGLQPPANLVPTKLPPPAIDPHIPPAPYGTGGDTLPETGDYTSHSPGAVFSSIQKSVGDNSFGLDGPPETYADWLARGWFPQFVDPSFGAYSSSSGLDAQQTDASFIGYGNIAFGPYGYDRRNVSSYKSKAILNLASLTIAARSRVFLVGTIITSNGSLVAPTTTVTQTVMDVSAYATIASHQIFIEPPAGITATTNPDLVVNGISINRFGRLEWNEIRIYDPLPL